MKVILYMATSLNGYIAKLDHETPWSEAEWESYSAMVKEKGNLVVGKTTYDLMLIDNDFASLGSPLIVCLTHSNQESSEANTVFVTSFEEAVKVLEERGFGEALIGGGGLLNRTALESGLLDEIYIDMEPKVFGDGIPLFSSSDRHLELELLSTKKIGQNGVQMHYKVKKD